MTVNELMAALTKCDGNAIVYYDYEEREPIERVLATKTTLVAGRNQGDDINIVELRV